MSHLDAYVTHSVFRDNRLAFSGSLLYRNHATARYCMSYFPVLHAFSPLMCTLTVGFIPIFNLADVSPPTGVQAVPLQQYNLTVRSELSSCYLSFISIQYY